MPELVEIPDDMAVDIAHTEDDVNAWPWLTDRDSDLWAASTYTWKGEQVLIPFAAGELPATRSSVEAVYGPLTDQPHCPRCGTTLFWENGVCAFRNDTAKHPRHASKEA